MNEVFSTPLEEDRARRAGLRRLLGVAIGLLLLVVTTYLIPGLAAFRPWAPGEGYVPFWNIVGRELLGEEEEIAVEAKKLRELERVASKRTAPVVSTKTSEDRPPQVIDLDTFEEEPTFPAYVPLSAEKPVFVIENVEALDDYFRKLTLVDMKVPRTIARAGHWGDSIIADDGETFGIRRRLQERFGDAGHGFHALARYNAGYMHRGVRYHDNEKWATRCQILFKCESDGRYGYAGVSVRSSGLGRAIWRTSEEWPGDRVSRFELWYALSPGGGQFEVLIDGESQGQTMTDSEEPGEAVAVFAVPDGPHEFVVRASNATRGYGAVLERDGPGVVWDNLTLIGAFTQRLDYQEPEHIASQIKRRNLDLLVFQLGGNDVQRENGDLRVSTDPYKDEFRNVITKYRAGARKASCLVLGVTDHGSRTGQTIRSRPVVPRLVAAQREMAHELGCAFFDLFTAMGGDGSIARWVYAKPALASGDLGHPTSEGHEILAGLIVDALLDAYTGYRKRMTGQPLPELDYTKSKSNDAPN